MAKDKANGILIHVILIVVAFVMIVPFLWMFLTAFKTIGEATSINPFVIFPSSWKLDSFLNVWKNYNFLVLYKNTLLMIFFRVVCAVLTATMAGYAFGRMNFPGKKYRFYTGYDPDDGAGADLYHPTVRDGIEAGTSEHAVCAGISGRGDGFWNLPSEDQLPGASQRYGRGGHGGRVQLRPEISAGHGSADQKRHGIPGDLYRGLCV